MNYLSHWMVPAVLLLIATGFVSLGRWQLERAEVNRDIEHRFVEADRLDVLSLPLADISAERHRYRRIRLMGHYDPTTQILLDNMTRDGAAGYEVLTTFVVDDASRDELTDASANALAGQRVLVNRGWVPAGWDRAELPDIRVWPRAETIEGKIDRLPRVGLKLGEPAPADEAAVVVLSFPEFDQIESVLRHAVFDFQLLLSDGQAQGYTRSWGPETNRDERNIAYAVQWFALAAAAISIAIGIAVNGYRRRKAAA